MPSETWGYLGAFQVQIKKINTFCLSKPKNVDKYNQIQWKK